jgi:hypothetical protein
MDLIIYELEKRFDNLRLKNLMNEDCFEINWEFCDVLEERLCHYCVIKCDRDTFNRLLEVCELRYSHYVSNNYEGYEKKLWGVIDNDLDRNFFIENYLYNISDNNN